MRLVVGLGLLSMFLVGCVTPDGFSENLLGETRLSTGREPEQFNVLDEPAVQSESGPRPVYALQPEPIVQISSYRTPPQASSDELSLALPSADSIHRLIKARLLPDFPQVAGYIYPVDVGSSRVPPVAFPEISLPLVPDPPIAQVLEVPLTVVGAEPQIGTPATRPASKPAIDIAPVVQVPEVQDSVVLRGSLVEPATIRVPLGIQNVLEEPTPQVIPPVEIETERLPELDSTPATDRTLGPEVAAVAVVPDASAPVVVETTSAQPTQTLQIFPNQTLTLRLEGFGWLLDFIRSENGDENLENTIQYGASGMTYILSLPEIAGTNWEIGFTRTILATGESETKAFEVQVVADFLPQEIVASSPDTQFLEVNYDPDAYEELVPLWSGMSPDAQLFYKAQGLEIDQTSSSIRQSIGLYRELLNSYPLSDFYIEAGNRIRYLERHYVMIR